MLFQEYECSECGSIQVYGAACNCNDSRVRSEFIGNYRRPDGYAGDSRVASLCFYNNKLIEVYNSGFISSPFLAMDIQDSKEAEWLIENHPSSRYTKIH